MSTLYIPRAAAGDPLSDDYAVTVNGQALPVHGIRVSAMAYDRWWPGHQRNLDQTEMASYGTFDFEGRVCVEVTVRFAPIEKVEIRPAAFGIVPEVCGDRIRFTLDRPRHFSVEVNGWHRCLHLFTNAPEAYDLSPDDPAVLYFGPGIHHAGLLMPASGQTIYIHPEAVVYAQILLDHTDNVRILGHGVIDSSIYHRLGDFSGHGDEPHESDAVELAAKEKGLTGERLPHSILTGVGCTRTVVDGVILRDAPYWCCDFGAGCDDLLLNNIKIIGMWRHNSDGLDLCSGTRYRVRNCYIRTFDDSIIIRAAYRNCDPREMGDIVVEDTVMWCDWGRAIEFWSCSHAADIRNVVFRRCQVVRATHIAIDFQVYGGSDADYHDILLEDIEVMCDEKNDRPVYQWEEDTPYPGADPDYVPMLFYCGHTRDLHKERSRVRMHDITVRRLNFIDPHDPPRTPVSNLDTVDGLLAVYDLTLEDWFFNGKRVETDIERGFTIRSRWDELPPEDRY